MEEPKEKIEENSCMATTEIWQHYRFDQSYFEEVDVEGWEEENLAIFRLRRVGVMPTRPKFLYLHIFNQHNGYYGHGFEMKINDKITQSGSL